MFFQSLGKDSVPLIYLLRAFIQLLYSAKAMKGNPDAFASRASVKGNVGIILIIEGQQPFRASGAKIGAGPFCPWPWFLNPKLALFHFLNQQGKFARVEPHSPANRTFIYRDGLKLYAYQTATALRTLHCLARK